MTCIEILTIIGAIGLFLYGMKLMSEGLQKLAGDSLRSVLEKMTKNRFTSMLTGLFVTAVVQSSAATTVMILSFVNAGMITLEESMAAIIGSNVGTTITPWLIALLSFKAGITPFLLPLIALALPLFQSKHSQRNSLGEFLLGTALLFLSVAVMQEVMPTASEFQLSEVFLQYCHQGWTCILLFLLIGILLTIFVQASSIMVVMAMMLCAGQWISFDAACALVMGANIGTCIMPIIVSRSANVLARRAAVGHLLFNVSGAIWMLCIFSFLCHDVIGWICQVAGLSYPDTTSPDYDTQVAICLALFHTLFNLCNLCVMLPLSRQLVRLVNLMIPEHTSSEDSFKLQFISSNLISSSEMALAQVQKETTLYSQETYKMFSLVQEMLKEPLGSERQLMLNEKIRLMEEESDRAEVEIADFLNKISPKSLSPEGETLCQNQYKVVDELESIADSIYHISATLYAKSEQRVKFSPELNANVRKMFDLTDEALQQMLKVLDMNDVPPNVLNKTYNLEDEINNLRNQFRNDVLDLFDSKQVEYQQSTFFMILVNECEKIGDYVINVVTAACNH